jgi:hypothetical protein
MCSKGDPARRLAKANPRDVTLQGIYRLVTRIRTSTGLTKFRAQSCFAPSGMPTSTKLVGSQRSMTSTGSGLRKKCGRVAEKARVNPIYRKS